MRKCRGSKFQLQEEFQHKVDAEVDTVESLIVGKSKSFIYVKSKTNCLHTNISVLLLLQHECLFTDIFVAFTTNRKPNKKQVTQQTLVIKP